MNNAEIVTEFHTPAPSYVIPFNADAVNEIVWQEGVCTVRLAGPSREAARYVLFVDARIGTYKTLKSAVRRARIENGRIKASDLRKGVLVNLTGSFEKVLKVTKVQLTVRVTLASGEYTISALTDVNVKSA
jgi:hypothetical protein